MAPAASVAAILAVAGLGVLAAFGAIPHQESPPTTAKSAIPATPVPMGPTLVSLPDRPWVALVRPQASPPVRKARPSDAPTPRRTGSGAKRVPDPCATFRDFRRDYCYQVLDDLRGG